MGTRGLTKVIYNGEARVAQYGQWDHYPSGQGLTALTFLRDERNVTDLRNAVPNLRTATPEEVNAAWEAAGADRTVGWVTLDVSAQFNADHPEFSRDTGARILGLVATGAAKSLYLEADFENDGLWCEGVVEVNLDTNEFVWRYPGFTDSTYRAETREWRFPLSDLPTDEAFLAATEGEDE